MPGEVPSIAGALGARGERKILAGEVIGQLPHLGGVGASGMQRGAAASVDGAGVLAVQRDNVAGPAGRILEIEVRERLPAATQTENLDVVLAAAVGNALDDCVEAGDVPAAGENADALFR